MTEVNAPPSTIVEFLTARLDEDEADGRSLDYLQTGEFLLADALAKRAIIALHAPSGNECQTCCGEPYMEECWDGEAETVEWKRADLTFPCPTLRLLASVYADHPGYREEWTR